MKKILIFTRVIVDNMAASNARRSYHVTLFN